MEMFANDARGILHGHGIAGKTGHAGAESAMQIVKRRAGEIVQGGDGGGLTIGHRNTARQSEWRARVQKSSRSAPLCPKPERFPSPIGFERSYLLRWIFHLDAENRFPECHP